MSEVSSAESVIARVPGLAEPRVCEAIASTVRHRVGPRDLDAAGNVYFATYFVWQGECRDLVILEHCPELRRELALGSSLVTASAQMDFFQDARLFDAVTVELSVASVTATRIAFQFLFVREHDHCVLARGRQAVAWVDRDRQQAPLPEGLVRLARALGAGENQRAAAWRAARGPGSDGEWDAAVAPRTQPWRVARPVDRAVPLSAPGGRPAPDRGRPGPPARRASPAA